MTRIVYAGGRVFDGTGADPFTADVAVADGLIAEVGTGLDGDEVVDVAAPPCCPASSTATSTCWRLRWTS